ncbi:MAG: hypothetical protein JOZ54_13250 [Acidobacteria bacterium]|nr:hypothetical protein [Acidobacteriota bacterium]
MRKLSMIAAATLLAATTLHAQYKPKPGAQPQPQPPVQMPPLIGSGAIPAPQPAPADGARRIGRNEAIKLVKSGKAIFIDVRSKEAYDEEHIKGAISIPLDEVVQRIKELPRNKLLVTYCA